MSETSTNYEYTDEDGDKLEINLSGTPSHFLIHVLPSMSDSRAVRVPFGDAPAVALAILEAAGIDPKNGQPGNAEEAARKAMYWLAEAVESAEDERRQRAEREAEDAKVQEWLDARNAEVGATDHWELDDAARAGYRASKAFWEKHLGACDEGGVSTEDLAEALGHKIPRVLQHGDPEPDHGTRWRDRQGDTWSYGKDPNMSHLGWRWIERTDGTVFSARDWRKIGSHLFPMTEATN